MAALLVGPMLTALGRNGLETLIGLLKRLAPHRGWFALAGGLAVLMLVLALSPAIRSLSERAESYIQAQSDPSVALPPFDELYSPEAMEYFLVAAFGGSDSAGADLGFKRATSVVKWSQDIYVCVEGATALDLLIVSEVIATLRGLIKPVEITRVDCAEEFNFQVVITSVLRFNHYVAFREFGTVDTVRIGGTAALYTDERNSVHKVIALINSSLVGKRRSHAIWEEISHGVGSTNDSYHDPRSLFYEGPSFVFRLTDIDKEIIRILYDPRIKPGMKYCDVFRLFRSESSERLLASETIFGAEDPDRC